LGLKARFQLKQKVSVGYVRCDTSERRGFIIEIQEAIAKEMMMKEALASCQMEGIGVDLTLEDLYLAELLTPRKDGDL